MTNFGIGDVVAYASSFSSFLVGEVPVARGGCLREPRLQSDAFGEPARGPANADAAAPEPSWAPTEPTAAEEGPKVRAGTKQAVLIELLRRPEGTTIDEVMAATVWQAHTIRGAMARALKKKLGLEMTSEKVGGRGRVYRIR